MISSFKLVSLFSFQKSHKHSQVNSQVILIIISKSDNPCGIWYIVYMPCQCNVECQNKNEKTHKSTSQLWWPINLLQVYHQFYFGDNKKWENFFHLVLYYSNFNSTKTALWPSMHLQRQTSFRLTPTLFNWIALNLKLSKFSLFNFQCFLCFVWWSTWSSESLILINSIQSWWCQWEWKSGWVNDVVVVMHSFNMNVIIKYLS